MGLRMQRTINLDNKKLDALGVCFFLLLGATGVAVSLHCMQRIATERLLPVPA